MSAPVDLWKPALAKWATTLLASRERVCLIVRYDKAGAVTQSNVIAAVAMKPYVQATTWTKLQETPGTFLAHMVRPDQSVTAAVVSLDGLRDMVIE